MGQVIRLFCGQCNPQDFFRPDRRAAQAKVLATVVPFVDKRRQQTDRRQMFDRRRVDLPPPGQWDRRCPQPGRRYSDGYAWFDGCLEEAVRAHWHVQWEEESEDDRPALVLCPKCRRKIR
ncbi:hypothetical protein [Candidatus Magnetaquicoccus inordinatus]|uniref:hypothetical protein n=1 Tax=Candidatus Magnetaquicoccus inordinatus TaxID=2496818 RepID=UPI00102ACAB4|nr:hypothetical protein [Candidatus Magnetaquicoccus inordinatus]